ncbi:hypothetical protein [Intrasporangium sp. YIM S08009]|uniref:hypothetical protein n=1 Tax=Intrasporangium zincisolvens TaxID=3080018 RepID=UPI002B0532CE|nr:hypothetical protein [Intrasporangium sp. YIM S08009]
MTGPDVEELTRRALHEVADSVDVTARDLERLEPAWERPAARPRPGRWLVAAVTLLVLALAGLAVLLTTPQRSRPAAPAPTQTSTGLSADQLVGLWRVDGDFDPTLWAFGPGGTMEQLKKPGELVASRSATTMSYRLTGTTLTVSVAGTCTRTWAVAPDPVGVVLERTATQGDCDAILDAWWVHGTLTRLVPSAGRVVQPKYVGGGAVVLNGMSGLTGTWLLRGGGRLLAVDEAPAGVTSSPYVVTDRATDLATSGDAAMDERGTATVGRDGTVTFTPDGAGCDRRYRSVRSDYATLDAQLVPGSCGRLGGTSDTWVRLN